MMLKYIAALLLMTSAVYAADQLPPKPTESCKVQIPHGMPVTDESSDIIICRTGYILAHDIDARIPDWVAWTLTPERVIGCIPRTDAFAADQSIPAGQRAELTDYDRSGYDRGHLANNADLSWDAQAQKESFLLSNMSPQLPSVNRGVWKNLEQAERAWVYATQHSFTIYAGNIYSSDSKTIGSNKVVVPDFLYKILVDNVTKMSYSFIMPHRNGLDSDFTKYQTTLFDIETVSGMIFPVPDDKMKINTVPTTDLRSYADKKKQICK
jgi:endonuclease G